MQQRLSGFRAVAIAGSLLWGAALCLAQGLPAGVPKDRLGRLAKGVNLSMWFAQLPFDANRVRSYITEDDARRMKALGLGFVRLPVDPTAMAVPRNLTALDGNRLAFLDAALELFLKEDLAVVVCPYFSDDLKGRLFRDNNHAKAFGGFLGGLARHLGSRDPNLIFIEVLNEPMTSVSTWERLQRDWTQQIRRAAPSHTIIAASNWIAGLLAMQPLPDKNVVYDFHFYDPVQFTHQGATWMPRQMHFYKGLPYPSSPQAVRPFLAGVADEKARAFLELYGREQWGRQRVQGQLQKAIDWGKKNQVPVLCGEFGVYRPNCPAADRVVYLRDVREILEGAGVGWAMWEYYGSFGVVIDKDGKRVVDRDVAGALGLTPPPAEPAGNSATAPAGRP